jgi:hypothetical protein
MAPMAFCRNCCLCFWRQLHARFCLTVSGLVIIRELRFISCGNMRKLCGFIISENIQNFGRNVARSPFLIVSQLTTTHLLENFWSPRGVFRIRLIVGAEILGRCKRKLLQVLSPWPIPIFTWKSPSFNGRIHRFACESEEVSYWSTEQSSLFVPSNGVCFTR